MAARAILPGNHRRRHGPSARVYRSRLSCVQSEFHGLSINALLVTQSASLRYLTGFSGSNGLLVIRRSSARFFTDGRYRQQAHEEVGRAAEITIIPGGGLFEGAVQEGALRSCPALGFDDRALTYRQFRELRRLLPGITFRAVPDVIENLAAVKDETELAALSSAGRISDRVFQEVLPLIRPGLMERDLALEISYRQRRLGAESDSFEPIVAAGTRSAMPHARAGTRRIKRGDAVLMDFGCVVSGYGSDITRTVFMGRPHPRMKKLYDIVLCAQQVALGAVRAGISARALDASARRIIAREGFEEYFPHSLGHGIGINVHEKPRIAPASTDVLRKGNVITIEPGVYLPGIGGIRIEDDVVVEDRGYALLTHSSRNLIQL